MKHIFLDFDGVLHRSGAKSNPVFEHMDLFCDFIRDYKDTVRIVISSSWKESYKFKNLLDFFHDDIADIVIGVTPNIKSNLDQGSRELEIKAFCETHDIDDHDWIAIDDMKILFNNHSKVIFTNPKEGITKKELELLKLFLEMKPTQNKTYGF